MDNVKLSVRLGPLDLQYEGSESFAKTEISKIIEQLAGLDLQDVVTSGADYDPDVAGSAPQPPTSIAPSNLSATDFAVKMGARSGTDLVMAAAACLHHTRKVEEFRRSEILAEMKSAKAFYKSSYSGNLSKSLDLLVKSGRLQNPKADAYALPYQELESTKRHL